MDVKSGPFTRVHKLLSIPVLNTQGRTIGIVPVLGRMALPLSIEKPVAGGSEPSDRYFLTLALGELVYLHEQVPVT